MYKLKISYRGEKGNFLLNGEGYKLYNSTKSVDVGINPIYNLKGECIKYNIYIGCMMGADDVVCIDLRDINNSEVYCFDSELKYEIYREDSEEKNGTKINNNITNLTPHTVNIISQEGEEIKSYKSEGIVRVSTSSVLKTVIDGVNIYNTEYGEVEGLPKEIDGVHYIVSMLVKQACPDRKDLLSPSQLQRDSEGRIIGCLGLE